MRKRDFRPDARLLPATSAIVQSVAEDEGAIGYVGLGYALDARGTIKWLAVRTSRWRNAACEPTRETVQTGRYPIVRPLRLFTSGEPTGLASSFLEFCLRSGRPGNRPHHGLCGGEVDGVDQHQRNVRSGWLLLAAASVSILIVVSDLPLSGDARRGRFCAIPGCRD